MKSIILFLLFSMQIFSQINVCFEIEENPNQNVLALQLFTKYVNVLDCIQEEYDLKRSQFDPFKKSPNLFNTKLQHRMKVYYHSLYNLSSSPTK